MKIEDIICLPKEAECAGVKTTRDLVIREIDGWQQKMLIFQPEVPSAKSPALLMVHGGGFIGNDHSEFSYVGRYLAIHHGITTFSPNYRLGRPEAPSYPKPVEDVEFAWRWMCEKATAWSCDPSKVFVGGGSAGGALTALALTTGRLPGCRGLVELWGPLDFIARWFDNGERAGAEINLLGVSYPQSPALYHEASALAHVKPGLPPALFIYGNQDPVVHKRQGALGEAAWKAAGSHAESTNFDNIGHGMQGDPRGQLAKVTRRLAEFLQTLV